MSSLFSSIPYWAGGLLTVAALIHFFVTRPDWYWIFVILFLGPLGSLVYLAVNVAMPYFNAGTGPLESRVSSTLDQRKRIRELEVRIDETGLPFDYAELGELLYRRGDYARAEQRLRHAVAEIHDEPEPRYWLALTLEKTGKAAEAASLLAPIIGHDPRYKFGDAYLAYARALAAAGKRPEALAAFQQVIAQSSFTEARVRYGLLLAETGDTEAARREMDTAVREARGLPAYKSRQVRPFVRQAKLWLARH